ncbi:flagellar motor switch protein FliN [Candidatus Latescibacterota bacterium]
MIADDNIDGLEENGNTEPDLSETMVSEGLGADDLEAEMATQMAAESLGSDDDDLEAQMAAAMAADDDDGPGLGDEAPDEEDLEAQMAAAMGGGLGEDDDLLSAFADEVDSESSTPVQPVSFAQLSPSEEKSEKGNIERLMDVGLNLSVELGRKEMQVKEILSLGPGKIIELDKLTGEPVDLLVNGKLLAKGEVVVVDENFGVRITELIDPVDRIKLL